MQYPNSSTGNTMIAKQILTLISSFEQLNELAEEFPLLIEELFHDKITELASLSCTPKQFITFKLHCPNLAKQLLPSILPIFIADVKSVQELIAAYKPALIIDFILLAPEDMAKLTLSVEDIKQLIYAGLGSHTLLTLLGHEKIALSINSLNGLLELIKHFPYAYFQGLTLEFPEIFDQYYQKSSDAEFTEFRHALSELAAALAHNRSFFRVNQVKASLAEDFSSKWETVTGTKRTRPKTDTLPTGKRPRTDLWKTPTQEGESLCSTEESVISERKRP